MPLTSYVLGWARTLHERLAGEAALLDVGAPAENLEMVARILAGWAARDAPDLLFVGLDASSEAAMVESLREAVPRIVHALEDLAAADSMPLRSPPRVPEPGASLEAAVEALDELARWARPLARRVVAGLRAPDALDSTLLSRALAATTPAVVWLLVRDERVALSLPEPLPRRAHVTLDGPSLHDARARLSAVLRGGGSRVVVHAAPIERGVRWIEDELALRARNATLVCVREAERTARRAAVRAILALGAGDETSGDPLAELGRALDERARDAPIIVVLPFEGAGAEARALVRGLARSVLSRRATVIVVAHALAGEGEAQHGELVRHPFRVDVARIEEGVRARAAEPALSPFERISLELALASLASGRSEHEDALARIAAALELARATDDAMQLATTLYVAGSVIARAGHPLDALDAWSRCAHAALDAGQPFLAGRALSGAGHLYFEARAWAEAIRCYVAATELAREAADAAGEVHASSWLGEAQVRAGRLVEGVASLEAAAATPALPVFEALLSPQRGEAHARLAAIFSRAGLAERAKEAARAAERAGCASTPSPCPLHGGHV